MEKQNVTTRRVTSGQIRSTDGFIVESVVPTPRSTPQPVAVKPQPFQQQVERPRARPATIIRRTARRPSKLRIAILTASIFLAGSLLMLNRMAGDWREPTKVGAVAVAMKRPVVQPEPASTNDPIIPQKDIGADMNAAIATQSGLQFSATLIDLATGQSYNAGNTDQNYTAASTSKLVAVFDYIHQVEIGKASLTQNIGGMTGQENIRRMIVYSDNDAWVRLNRYLSFKGEQAYLNNLGVTATIQEGNMQFSTPNMAKLLQLMYDGKLMNAGHQAMIYDYMSHTTVTNLIQAALPANTKVYHKYGQLEGVLHDASIVQYRGKSFILVIYTNNPAGTSSQNAAQVAIIHAVTQAAFNDLTLP